MQNLGHKTYHEALGKVIRNEREAQGLSLRKFGLMVGLDYKRMHEIEHGKANATINSLLRISDGLEISLSRLFAAAEKELASNRGAEADPAATAMRTEDLPAAYPAKPADKARPHYKYDYDVIALPSASNLYG